MTLDSVYGLPASVIPVDIEKGGTEHQEGLLVTDLAQI